MRQKLINIVDLKNKATQIIRDVEASRVTYIVTKHAVPVAVIRAIQDEERMESVKIETTRFIEEGLTLSKKFSGKKTATQEFLEERR